MPSPSLWLSALGLAVPLISVLLAQRNDFLTPRAEEHEQQNRKSKLEHQMNYYRLKPVGSGIS